MRQIVAISIIALLASFHVRASGAPFVNLNFEQAQIPPGTIPTSLLFPEQAFPGWTLRRGTAGMFALYDDVGIGAPAISIFDQPFPDQLFPTIRVPEGRYFAFLVNGSSGPIPSVSISQIGDVPADAVTLRFISGGESNIPRPRVFLGGQELSPTLLGTGMTGAWRNPGYWGVSIDAFQGMHNLELRFEGINFNAYCALDLIQFSNEQIPEPSVIACVGTACLLARRRTASPQWEGEFDEPDYDRDT